MTHGHGDGEFDWAAMAEALELDGELSAPAMRRFLDGLGARDPRRVLDIGSGPGVAACAFAAAFPRAEVIAVDAAPELLARAATRAARHGVRVRTQVTELPANIADLPSADVIWSARFVHHVGDQRDALRRLAAVLEPGGVMAIAEGGLPFRYLPRDLGFGRPGLQDRLDAAEAERFTRMRQELPGSVRAVEDWPGMLRAAGLITVRAKSFLIEHPAPLSGGPRRAVRVTLEHRRQSLASWLDAVDLAALDRLLDPDDPAGVDNRDDVFVLGAQTVFLGQRPA